MSKQILSCIGYVSRVCTLERSPNEFLEYFAVLGAKVLGTLTGKSLLYMGELVGWKDVKLFPFFRPRLVEPSPYLPPLLLRLTANLEEKDRERRNTYWNLLDKTITCAGKWWELKCWVIKNHIEVVSAVVLNFACFLSFLVSQAGMKTIGLHLTWFVLW